MKPNRYASRQKRAILLRCRRKAAIFRSLVAARKNDTNYPCLIDTYWRWLRTVPTGVYSSPEIEQYFIDQYIRLPPPPIVDPIANTTLVVMSEAFEYGGHTRWVEKWIASDPKRSYSIALTRKPRNALPKFLGDIVKGSGGKVYFLDGDDARGRTLLELAEKLRDLSLRFQSVLIGVHMDDPLPLVAYGSNQFTRPIAFLNHGNHLFWVGISIADVIVECGKWQKSLTENRRGATTAVYLPMPQYTSMLATEEKQNEARNKLAIPREAFVVITAGPATKYGEDGGVNYADFIEHILLIDKRIYFVAVGMKWSEVPEWQHLRKKFDGRFLVVDRMPLNDLRVYFFAANLLVDSFPFTGGGVMYEASVCGCPCLTQRRTFGTEMYLSHFNSVGSVERFVEDCVRDPDIYKKLRRHCLKAMTEIMANDKSVSDLHAFMNRLDSMSHCIHEFIPKIAPIDDNDSVIFETCYCEITDKTLSRMIQWYAIRPQVFGLVVVHIFTWLRYIYGRLHRWFHGSGVR